MASLDRMAESQGKKDFMAQAKRVAVHKGIFTRYLNEARMLMAGEDDKEAKVRELQIKIADTRDVIVDEIYTLAEQLADSERFEEAVEKEKELKLIDNRLETINDEIASYVNRKTKAGKKIASEGNSPLQPIKLPSFSGKDYFRWRAIFDIAVDSQEISKKFKMLNLITCLEGEPKELIAHYPPTAESYDCALHRLEELYGGKRRLMAEAIQNVRQGRIIDEENLSDVKRFLAVLEATVVTMKETNYKGELTEGGALIECAKDRMSRSFLREYTKWTISERKEASFESLINFLSEWIQILSSSMTYKAGKAKSQVAFLNTAQNTNKDKKGSTFRSYCLWHKIELNVSEPHYLDSCDSFKALTVKQRRDFVYKNKLCRVCLKPNHIAKDCKNGRGRCRTCPQATHHFLLHEKPVTQTSDSNDDSVESHSFHLQSGSISLQTIPVKISNGNKTIIVNALLDIGSNSSFIRESLVKELGLKEYATELKQIHTMNRTEEDIRVSKVKIDMESLNGNVRRRETLMTIKDMLMSSYPTDWSVAQHEWEHLRSVKFPRLAKRDTHELLIGTDLIFYHRCLKEIRGPLNGPIARLTPLGWSCFGRISKDFISKNINTNHCKLEDLNVMVQKQWDTDSFGFTEDLSKRGSTVLSEEDVYASELLKSGLKTEDNRYVAPILWKEGKPDLKDNFDAVCARTKRLELRLKGIPDAFEKYDEVIENYKEKHYLKKVPDNDRCMPCFYLPHFPIFRDDRLSTKLRVVFDCAARYSGSSLNDQIMTGPKLQNDITKVLTRFRMYRYGIIGDISEMYLQISLADKDWQFCRFMWKGETFEWQRTMFGRADAPFIALYVIQNHAQKYSNKFKRTVDSVINSFYIDDLADSRDDPEEVKTLVSELSQMFSEASMKIHKWMTNCEPIMYSVFDTLSDSVKKNLLEETLPMTKLLGMSWDVKKDTLCYEIDIQDIHDEDPCTKRIILKALARIYDPLGLLDPFVITARVIFQKVWAHGYGWDDEVPTQLKREWLFWYRQVQSLRKIAFVRHLGIVPNFSLHVFCDASIEAYAAVIYVRTQVAEEISTCLIMSKTRVTPLKGRTIPQLELMAGTIGVRLAAKIASVMKYDMAKITFWSDSYNVLYWIKRAAKYYKPFVSNRLGEIQSVTKPSQWRYVPSKLNSADLPSRGLSVEDLIENDMWWYGPPFLKLCEADWPENVIDESKISQTEERPSIKVCTTEIIEATFPLNPARWSSKRRLLRRLAYVCRFVDNCKKVISFRERTLELQPEEWQRAETTLIKLCQRESFPEELTALEEDRPINKKSTILKLCPFLDDQGVLRSRTRLQNVTWLDDNNKFPIILPKRHTITDLMVKDVHDDVGHALGTNATLAALHKRFWVVRGRVVVKNVQKRCSLCKINKAKVAQPQMAPLPGFRYSLPLQAFAVVGIDFAGPFETKAGRGKPRNKRYLALFTCLQTRAIHLEMVFSLETSSFVNALMRMMSRRGIPREIITDNAPTFKKCESELRSLMLKDKNKLLAVSQEPIKWHFNPPYGSHFGGVFEIMVKTAKRAIKHVLTSAEVNDEELVTAFCSVEGMVNDRPLTTTSDDINDLSPLTPNHFLIGRLNPCVLINADQDRESLHPAKRWKFVQTLLQACWSRWRKEILHSLKSRCKWAVDSHRGSGFRVGQVVVVLDPVTATRKWKVGRIEKLYPGPDGITRVVDVRYDNKVFRRPVNKLCSLEFEP